MLYEIYKNIFLKNWISWLSFLFGLGLLIYLIKIFDPSTIVNSLRKISLQQFGFILILKLIFSVVGALKWKIILKFYKRNLSLWKLYLFKTTIFSVSYFTPSAALGGQGIGALLLKNEKVPFKVGIVSILLDSILTGIITLIITLFVVSTFLLGFIYNLNITSTFLLSALFTIILTFLLFWLLKRVALGFNIFLKYKKLSKKLIPLRKSAKLFYDFLNYDKKTFIQVIFLSILSYFLVLVELFFILYFLGEIFTPLQLSVIEAGNIIAFLIPVSQALGVAESFASSTIYLLGSSAALGVSFALILRVKHTLIALIGIAVLIFYGLIKLRK